MDILTYLTAPAGAGGPLTWAFFVVQVLITLGGVYLSLIRQDTKALRKQAFQRLGYAMIALGVLGMLVAGLRLTVVEPFTARFWSLLVLVFELALAFYAWFYSRTIYPAQVAELAAAQRPQRRPVTSQRAAALAAAEGRSAEPVEEPIARGEGSGRRDSRRDRKRRKK